MTESNYNTRRLRKRGFYVSVAWFLCIWLIVLQTINLYILKFDFSYAETTMYTILYYMNYVGAFVYALFTTLNIGQNKEERKFRKTVQIRHLKYQLIVAVIIALMIPVHYFLSHAMVSYGSSYFTRALSLWINRIAIILTAYSLFNLMGRKAISYIIKLFIFMYFSLVIVAVFKYGLLEVGKSFLAILGVENNTECSMFLEVHEITFVFGLYLVYAIFQKHIDPQEKSTVVLSLIAFLIGGKRIGVAGLIVALFFYLLIKRLKNHSLIIKVWSYVAFAVCIIFVAMVYDNRLFLLLNSLGIHPMGRDLLYRYFVRSTTFSPAFPGWGWGSVSTAFEYMTNADIGHLAGNVVALHSDILKGYIEFGFVGFLLWIFFQTIFLPKKLQQVFGTRTALFYCVIMTYVIITYLTDNTEGYYQFQNMLLCMISSVAYDESIQNIDKPNVA